MKTRFTFLLLGLLLCGHLSVMAQGPFTGKPKYILEAKRAGVSIGQIHLELFPLIAPLHTANFDNLVGQQFYDSTAFHRVIPGFMIQGGDPNSRSGPRSSWGFGQPGQPTVNAEFSEVSHVRGILSAARSSNINSATSQFFIVVAPSLHLDGQYTAYGRVTQGMSVADNIVSSARDGNDNPLQKIEMFITRNGSNDSIPVAPQQVHPANGWTGAQATENLTWQPVSDAAMYHLQVATDALFSNLLTNTDLKQTATSFAATSLSPQSTYFWRIRTNNGGHLSPWSTTRSFSTGLAGGTLASPATASTNHSLPLSLQWNTVTGADAYRLQVGRNPFFLPGTIDFDSSGISALSYSINNLFPNTRYYWRVAPMQNGTSGFFSPAWNFRTGQLTGIEEAVTEAASLQVYPNPTAGSATVAYKLLNPGPVQLRLTDLTGREVYQTARQQQPGDYVLDVAAESLAPGIYLLQLHTATSSTSRKLVVE